MAAGSENSAARASMPRIVGQHNVENCEIVDASEVKKKKTPTITFFNINLSDFVKRCMIRYEICSSTTRRDRSRLLRS